MCGIVCAFETKNDSQLRPKVLEMAKKIRHRGPDWSGNYSNKSAIIAHERLAIVDPSSGQQPLFSQDDRYVLAANGEIYNHRELRKQTPNYSYQTGSDCEVILALFQVKGVNFIDELNGIFAFVLFDAEQNTFFVVRDHMGIIPLYMGWDANGTLYFASELKSLEG